MVSLRPDGLWDCDKQSPTQRIHKVQFHGSLTPHFSCQPIAWRAADEPLLISLTLTCSRFLLHPLTALLPDPRLHILPLRLCSLCKQLSILPFSLNHTERTPPLPGSSLITTAVLQQCKHSISESLSFPTFSVPSALTQPHQVGFPVVSKCPSLLFVHKYTL